MSKLKYKELVSKRLILRMPNREDYKYQMDYMNNPLNYPFADYKITKSMDDIEEYFEKMLSEHISNTLFWMVADKKTNEPVGMISAWNTDWKEMTIEFGYSIYPKYRGKGYMKEALEAAIDYIKEENNFYLFDIWTDIHNKSSIRLAESLGFDYQGDKIEKAHNSEKDITYATYRLDLRKEID